MSIDRAKVLQAAQKHLAKGQLDKAIVEYRRLMQDDPKDARTLLKIGDIYTRKGDTRGATAAYSQVAEHYADQGFFLKAVAVYKQILKLDPALLTAWEKLAEMYELLSLVSDALSTYDQLATAYTKANDTQRALNALGKMVELDPDNVPATIKYAEALSRAGRPDEAAQFFAQGAARLKDQGRIDDYIKVAERLLFHRPNDVDLARELAGMYLERGDAKHALAKLQTCFKVDPKDVPTLQLLAEAFHLLGQHAKTISVYEEVARLHADAGREHQRRAILRRILELDPGHEEAMAEVGGRPRTARPSHEVMPSAAVMNRADTLPDEPSGVTAIDDDDFDPMEDFGARPGMAPTDDFDPHGDFAAATNFDELSTGDLGEPEPEVEDDLVFADDVVFADDPLDPMAAPPRASRPSGFASSVPPPDASAIPRMLKECDVFMRYGLHDKVMAQIERILELDPSHVGARVRLKDALIAIGNTADAVTQILLLADDIGERDPDLASDLLTEAIRLEPDNDVARAQLQSLRLSVPAEGDVEPLLISDEEMEDDSPTGRRSLVPEHRRSVAPVDNFDDFGSLAPGPSDADDAVMLDADEDPFADEPVVETLDAGNESDDESATGLFSLPAAARSVLPPAKVSTAPARATAQPARISIPAPPAVTQVADDEDSLDADVDEEELPEDVSDALEEVDFYLAQGMTDEARDVLNDALSNHPGLAALTRKLAELDGGSVDDAPEAATGEADQSFALAEKLAQDADMDRVAGSGGGDQPVDVQDVLAQFKQGVSKQVDRNDAATHYDLGIAYMEMGLHDDAISEFKLCLISPTHVCTAHTMIGLSFLAKGDWLSSIEHFKGALAAPHNASDELGLWFELGNAYELLGKLADARDYYTKVNAVDAGFRDVAARLQRVSKQKPKDEGDEFDSLFDNMILKD